MQQEKFEVVAFAPPPQAPAMERPNVPLQQPTMTGWDVSSATAVRRMVETRTLTADLALHLFNKITSTLYHPEGSPNRSFEGTNSDLEEIMCLLKLHLSLPQDPANPKVEMTAPHVANDQNPSTATGDTYNSLPRLRLTKMWDTVLDPNLSAEEIRRIITHIESMQFSITSDMDHAHEEKEQLRCADWMTFLEHLRWRVTHSDYGGNIPAVNRSTALWRLASQCPLHYATAEYIRLHAQATYDDANQYSRDHGQNHLDGEALQSGEVAGNLLARIHAGFNMVGQRPADLDITAIPTVDQLLEDTHGHWNARNPAHIESVSQPDWSIFGRAMNEAMNSNHTQQNLIDLLNIYDRQLQLGDNHPQVRWPTMPLSEVKRLRGAVIQRLQIGNYTQNKSKAESRQVPAHQCSDMLPIFSQNYPHEAQQPPYPLLQPAVGSSGPGKMSSSALVVATKALHDVSEPNDLERQFYSVACDPTLDLWKVYAFHKGVSEDLKKDENDPTRSCPKVTQPWLTYLRETLDAQIRYRMAHAENPEELHRESLQKLQQSALAPAAELWIQAGLATPTDAGHPGRFSCGDGPLYPQSVTGEYPGMIVSAGAATGQGSSNPGFSGKSGSAQEHSAISDVIFPPETQHSIGSHQPPRRPTRARRRKTHNRQRDVSQKSPVGVGSVARQSQRRSHNNPPAEGPSRQTPPVGVVGQPQQVACPQGLTEFQFDWEKIRDPIGLQQRQRRLDIQTSTYPPEPAHHLPQQQGQWPESQSIYPFPQQRPPISYESRHNAQHSNPSQQNLVLSELIPPQHSLPMQPQQTPDHQISSILTEYNQLHPTYGYTLHLSQNQSAPDGNNPFIGITSIPESRVPIPGQNYYSKMAKPNQVRGHKSDYISLMLQPGSPRVHQNEVARPQSSFSNQDGVYSAHGPQISGEGERVEEGVEEAMGREEVFGSRK